jgi:hypothetical protein
VTTLKTPSGTPASRSIRASSSAAIGVFSSTLMTTLLPAASAGTAFHTTRTSGKFHGTMPTQTPSGSRWT